MPKKKYESREIPVSAKPVKEYLVYSSFDPNNPKWTIFKNGGYPTKEQAVKIAIKDMKLSIKQAKADIKKYEKRLKDLE